MWGISKQLMDNFDAISKDEKLFAAYWLEHAKHTCKYPPPINMVGWNEWLDELREWEYEKSEEYLGV